MSTNKMSPPRHKRTFVSGRLPNTQDAANSSYIAIGEIALNLADRKIFTNDGTSTPIELGANVTVLQTQSLIANNTLGSPGQALLSTGSKVFWGDINGFTGSQVSQSKGLSHQEHLEHKHHCQLPR